MDFDKDDGTTKHLHVIGFILFGYQDATIWGDGFAYDSLKGWLRKVDGFIHRYYHQLDIRAVRCPETRRILRKMGYECAKIYGELAILTPKFYGSTFKN